MDDMDPLRLTEEGRLLTSSSGCCFRGTPTQVTGPAICSAMAFERAPAVDSRQRTLPSKGYLVSISMSASPP